MNPFATIFKLLHMKRFLFCIAMLFCMCMTMNAQGLKTYSGVYRANAHFLLGTQKATYTYKNAEDGDVPKMGACRYGANHVWNQLQ